jgi:hypothetical protein
MKINKEASQNSRSLFHTAMELRLKKPPGKVFRLNTRIKVGLSEEPTVALQRGVMEDIDN